jgi:hypothetical protein
MESESERVIYVLRKPCGEPIGSFASREAAEALQDSLAQNRVMMTTIEELHVRKRRTMW